MKLPTEMLLYLPDDTEFIARFEYDRGEAQWFDARAGVGSPGYPTYVAIYEVNFGNGWEDVDKHPEVDRMAHEDYILEKLQQMEADHIEAGYAGAEE